MSMKNSSDTVGNRTRDLLACSAVPQPTAPPRVPLKCVTVHIDSIHRVCRQPAVVLSVLQWVTLHIDSIHRVCRQSALVLSALQCVTIHDSIPRVYRQPAVVLSVLQRVTLQIDHISCV